MIPLVTLFNLVTVSTRTTHSAYSMIWCKDGGGGWGTGATKAAEERGEEGCYLVIGSTTAYVANCEWVPCRPFGEGVGSKAQESVRRTRGEMGTILVLNDEGNYESTNRLAVLM